MWRRSFSTCLFQMLHSSSSEVARSRKMQTCFPDRILGAQLWSGDVVCLFVFAFRVERSTDQVIKPVNVEALSKWVGKIPADVVMDMAVIAPMLIRLGYDPHANPPNYGRPDPKVLDNTRRVSGRKWEQRPGLPFLRGHVLREPRSSPALQPGCCFGGGVCFFWSGTCFLELFPQSR